MVDELPGIGEWASDVADYPLSQDPLLTLLEQEDQHALRNNSEEISSQAIKRPRTEHERAYPHGSSDALALISGLLYR